MLVVVCYSDDYIRLAIVPGLAQKLRAIDAHRSQMAPGVFTDDPHGFLLAPEMRARFAAPHEVYFEALPHE